ncbi:MAG: response regulator [Crocosphaera sp.]
MSLSNLKPNKIALRYLGLTSIGLLLAQLLFGVIQIRWRYYQRIEQLNTRIEDLGKQIRFISQQPEIKLDELTLKRLIRESSVGQDVVYGIILNGQGQVTSSFVNKKDPTLTNEVSYLPSTEEGNKQTQELPEILTQLAKHNPNYREIRESVIVKGESSDLGEVRLGYTVQSTQQSNLESAGKILVASLMVSGILIVIMFIMFKREVQLPIGDLLKKTQEVLPEEERLSLNQWDEIDQLEILITTLTQQLQSLQDLNSQSVQDKAREQAIKATEENRKELDQAKNEFLACIGHEIRTPLNAVMGMTALLLEDTQLNEQQAEFVKIIRDSGDNLLSMINNILDFSKIEAQKIELEEQSFELRPCVEEVLRLFVSQASEKNLELAYLVEPNTPSTIIGDITRLKQILANLIGNAVKFTHAGEVVIYISATPIQSEEETEGGLYELRFAVKDTGIGIPPERSDRLFQAFSQVDASTTRNYGGTGLGLVISKRLCELMGGNMWVHSIEGKGSTFNFTLTAKAGPSCCPVNSEEGESFLMGKRMLIIDDNLTNQKILTNQAQSWGMFTCAVDSGEKALEWLQRGIEFDVALLDTNMPQMDGLDLARRIRQEPHCAELPLVMLSSITQSEMACEEARDEFAAILLKPVQQSQLYHSLMQIFAGQPIRITPSQSEQLSEEPLLAQQLPLRILVAEDVIVNQEVIRLLLDKLGYWADMVSDGQEVLTTLKHCSYDVILMDVRMPEMDGLTTTRHIRQTFDSHQQPRIIAMTAESMPGDHEKCLTAGMDDYISKPIRIEALQQALSRCQGQLGSLAIDPQIFQELEQIAGKRLNGIIRGYLEDAPLYIDDMNRAIEGENRENLRQAAHALRSPSGSLGATHLFNLCQEIETIAYQGTFEEAKEKMLSLKMEYDRVCHALQK